LRTYVSPDAIRGTDIRKFEVSHRRWLVDKARMRLTGDFPGKVSATRIPFSALSLLAGNRKSIQPVTTWTIYSQKFFSNNWKKKTNRHMVNSDELEKVINQRPRACTCVLPCSVGDKAVSLHLAKPQSSVPRPAFCRLACQCNSRAVRSGMYLVHHHVLQLLIVDRTKEYVTHQRLPALQQLYNQPVNQSINQSVSSSLQCFITVSQATLPC